jgi:dienelactone hydrolase
MPHSRFRVGSGLLAVVLCAAAPPAQRDDFKGPLYADSSLFHEVELTINAGGRWALPATLTLPVGDGPFPGVVLVHGSGPHDRDETIGPNKPLRDLAWGLATRGVAVLRYVKRTREHPFRLLLGPALTIKEETIDDAVAAAALLGKQKGIDPKRVFVLGHSQGAFAAPRIGVEAPEVAGLVLLAGNSRPLEDLVLEQYTYLLALDGKMSERNKALLKTIEEQVKLVKDGKVRADTPARKLPLGLSAAWWLAMKAYDPKAAGSRYKKPMLVLQGERDYQVTMVDFAGWKKALAGRRDVTFKSYPSLNHLFMEGKGRSTPAEYGRAGHVAREVVDDVAAWVKRR